MMSKNGLITDKNQKISFISKDITVLLFSLLLAVIVTCSCIMFVYWSEMPILIKIFGPILLAITFIGIIITLLNGMIITKKGTILFFPDFRVKTFNIKDLKRISIIFNEWENNKYSATIKFVYTSEKVFLKDYSRQFKNMRYKKIAMSLYTINKSKVNSICENLSNLDVFIITIIDKDKKITYQN